MQSASTGPAILLVDDYEANLRAFAAMLDGCGASLVTATSGEGALALAEQRDFALAILDVGLPGIDGFTTARRLRALPRQRRMAILFVTGHATDSVLMASASGLAEGFLQKPVAIDALRSAVANVLSRFRRDEALESAAPG